MTTRNTYTKRTTTAIIPTDLPTKEESREVVAKPCTDSKREESEENNVVAFHMFRLYQFALRLKLVQ